MATFLRGMPHFLLNHRTSYTVGSRWDDTVETREQYRLREVIGISGLEEIGGFLRNRERHHPY